MLVPRPSYPLFEHLTRLDAVAAVPYDLEYHGAWTVDLDSVERAFSGRTRAVLIVSPNNPTGSFVKQPELDRIAALGALHDAAIIVDEVFADYELVEGAAGHGAQVLTRGDVPRSPATSGRFQRAAASGAVGSRTAPLDSAGHLLLDRWGARRVCSPPDH